MQQIDKTVLIDLATKEMPYGKYKGVIYANLPEPYLSWYHSKGFPKGRTGILLQSLYEIKLNGLENLLKPLMKA